MTTPSVEEYRKRKDKLVQALRSGEYKQGQNYLRFMDTFCCLGVACDVSKISSWSPYYDAEAYLSEDSELPEEVRRYFGFQRTDGKFKDSSLMGLNDEKNKSFEEIADIIDKEPEGLFTWSNP